MAETTAAHHGQEHDFEEHHGAGRYFLIWVALLIGTALTFWTSRYDLGTWNIVVALTIACTKSALVVLFFMHLAEQKGANRLIFAISMAFLFLLMGFSVFGDIATRNKFTNPPSGQGHNTVGVRYAVPGETPGHAGSTNPDANAPEPAQSGTAGHHP